MSFSKDIFFSVVIPTYNRAGFIVKAIESVLAQTYPHFELIVIDDGSTDNTGEMVRGIKDARVSYVKKENGERGAARNTGAKMAKGAYVNFLDSDDLLYNNHLEIAAQAIKSLGAPEVLHLGFDVKDPEGHVMRVVNDFGGDLNRQLIEGNVLSCNGVFVRKDIIIKHPFIEDRQLAALEDWELWLRLAAMYPIHYNNTVTSTLVNHDARSVLVTDKDKLITRSKALIDYALSDDKVVRFMGKRKKAFIANVYTYVALHLALEKKYKGEVLNYLLLGVANNPSVLFTRRFLAIIKHFF